MIDAWFTVNSQWEGYLPYMYLDALGYVTTGMGNLIDPIGAALVLPWGQNSDGSNPASQAQIAAAWNAVDSLRTAPKGQKQGGPAATGGQRFGGYTTLRLSKQAITDLVTSKLAQNEASVKPYYPSWDNWPADAQFAVMSMAWAMGTGFANPKSKAAFPQFDAAMNAGQFATASPLSHMRGVGIDKRNAANAAMLLNAQAVSDRGLDPNTLYWPSSVPPGPSPGLGTPSSVPGGLIVATLLGLGLVGAWYVYRG